ncbi:MAG: methyltransferase domain-containing protein [Candidatus Omnitrophica bacterium]|nr:methyltransferase domain-containing protein [Candidatus Omnitrophota bacterium]MCA9414797.1 methyltransferase domain-containing protein [Candidatus Omnitrophota bacterium]MCA9424043.1 methyltransferase domain-containing protein [Candidatus Omnitrophota bacterium]MCA9435886.1 methyltransferase domain-containing protein [Candidatus Omnitrophota bacterium]MCA9442986.1 methyltransferase domain-containing protein [Candidatus Omnitrophota bacterium]
MNEQQTQWYAEWFNEDYLKVYSHRNDDLAIEEVDFIIATLRLRHDLPILDLCCGGGRHLKQLINRGYERTFGIDLSPSLLEVANRELESKSHLVRGDMRWIPFRCSFQAILSFFTSFGYFPETAENLQVLREIRRLLLPNGKVVLDLPSFGITQSLVPRTEKKVGDLVVVEERQYVSNTRRLEKQISISGPEGTQEFLESVRVYSFREMRQMMAEAGLAMVGVWGDFQGNSFNHDSHRMILFGMRDDSPAVISG